MKTKISLRLRITLLTGAVITGTVLLLTLAAMANASTGLYTVSDTALQIIAEDQIEETPSPREDTPDIDPSVITEDIIANTAEDGRGALIIQRRLEAKQRFNLLSIAFGLGAAAFGMAAAYLLAGRALAPVRQLNQAAGEISAHNLRRRLSPVGAPDEIGGLIVTFNSMLDRLAESFESQKRFSSNVAHELKTPLATMKMSLQVARLENQTPENELFFETTERGVDRLSSVVADLLTLTDEAPVDCSGTIVPAELLLQVVDELSPAYADQALCIETDFQDPTAAIAGNEGLCGGFFIIS